MGPGDKPAGVILAGGRSTRFGSDKASARLNGRPLLQWVADALSPVCAHIVVVRARGQVLPEVLSPVPLRLIDDVYDDLGPIAGLVAAFRALEGGLAVAVSCDTPLLQPALLRAMVEAAGDHDAVCGRAGSLQPLPGVFRVEACLPVFERRVADRRLALRGVFDDLRVRVLEEPDLRRRDPALDSFRGANTPLELSAIEATVRDPSRTAG